MKAATYIELYTEMSIQFFLKNIGVFEIYGNFKKYLTIKGSISNILCPLYK